MEDSFTNIFKLAELNGLTWKKFSYTNPVPSLPADDQVLSAYAKCMKEGVLCTWRRQARVNTFFSKILRKIYVTYTLLQLETSDKENDKEYRKELWCFWWGDEPPVLGTLTELEADPSSTWGEEAPNAQEGEKIGLDYQSRSLLFKGTARLFVTWLIVVSLF